MEDLLAIHRKQTRQDTLGQTGALDMISSYAATLSSWMLISSWRVGPPPMLEMQSRVKPENLTIWFQELTKTIT
jgi:hypothetical protein